MTERASHESAWVSAHVFYPDDVDRLVVDVVGPLVDEFTGGGLAREFFFLRYWDGGNHLRLRVQPVQDTRRGEVEKLISDRFGDYLARNPAADRMLPEEYARFARVLAEREGVLSYAEQLYPRNSISFIPYRREHDRYGCGVAIQAVERHFAESSRIALRVLTMGASVDQRTAAATAFILLAWFTGCPAPGRRLVTWVGDRDVADLAVHRSESFKAVVERQREQTIDLARQMRVLAAEAGKLSVSGTLIDWTRSITILRDALVAQVATGSEFTSPARGFAAAGRIATLDPEARVFRVLDICAHLICNRLGVSIIAEQAIREFAAEAVGVLAREGN